jgi:hypothetical protein
MPRPDYDPASLFRISDYTSTELRFVNASRLLEVIASVM